jgi:hypothetical protein
MAAAGPASYSMPSGRMMGAHVLREPGKRESVPIHVLIQSHIQPGNTLLLSFDHISDCVLDR